jgi:hypothetical protein
MVGTGERRLRLLDVKAGDTLAASNCLEQSS